ncbi:hypothetical protein [Rathayibacter toxicus]|uniref:hypothetical protein n=1 Tax=Rathayibacter toxicus TaxID=145458 RepID=UPI001C048EED|nr:hypothetical protein [Rathayibacter toxicus]QWL31564.1 hypothetical protein E2R35_00965 [Rathayibacter toxicus]QWL33656.1 hypothetical protein E2R36_00965 [Rathayibacter toxicus]QWL35791.1 hypothetical protein E2R37_00965 [Rathayibacter toxicus]QWL37880.1 hypothetical protein E2R38_00965 [Rathayibacter toxicus]QWL39970.1 hypothetical protein E2R39_00965 [Rathayibacter toxicus]
MSDTPSPPPRPSDNPAQLATARPRQSPPQTQHVQGVLRGLDIMATVLFTFISVAPIAAVVSLIEAGENDYHPVYTKEIWLHSLTETTRVIIWMPFGAAVACAIVRIVLSEKAWWVPLTGLGVSGICLCVMGLLCISIYLT